MNNLFDNILAESRTAVIAESIANADACLNNVAIPNYSELKAELANSKKTIERALRFIADLNGCEWIKGNDAGSIDMKQRSRALQVELFKDCNYLNTPALADYAAALGSCGK